MNISKITEALAHLFNQENQRIVFWNDPDREFESLVPDLQLEGVQVIELHKTGQFAVKIRLEVEDPAGRYLLYAPTAPPDFQQDWLLDIRLYSRSFSADQASILLDELGLANHHLRSHLAARKKFFESKERLARLQTLVSPQDLEADLDRKMVAVLVKSETAEWAHILRTIFHALAETEGPLDLDVTLPLWEQVERFDLTAPFWEMAKLQYGYSDEAPSLKKLLIRLFVTDFVRHLRGETPASLKHLVLAQGQANAVVLLGHWRDSTSKNRSYDRISAHIAKLLDLPNLVEDCEIKELLEVMTFLAVEKVIASKLRELVETTAATVNAQEVRAIASRRQAGYWASTAVADTAHVPRRALQAVYEALALAAEFFELQQRYPQGFDYAEASHMYRAYEQELYRFDQLYRLFCEHADQAQFEGWNILKSLREAVEAAYTNWFVQSLALGWDRFVDPQGPTALLTHWQLTGVQNQYRFFDRYVAAKVDTTDHRKVYVIISDAFRFEAAQELTTLLNGKYRFEATLGSQLGVLPSYTTLGMAALLPGESLAYKPNGTVVVDGKPTGTLADRHEILKLVNGMACHADELMALKKEAGRDLVRDKKVVYVYHNKVDAIGDSASSEAGTFDAVREAINELAAVVGYIINNLGGNQIFVTADHGFLFSESVPGKPDKSKLEYKPDTVIKAKKRYLIGRHLPDAAVAWHGHTSSTARAAGEVEFWIPKSANRFHFSGGARFIHGGATLQEIVVPVVSVRQIRGKSMKDTETRPVKVEVLGKSHKIITNRHRFEFIQTEAVSERLKPLTLKIGVFEGDAPVSTIETVTFGSNSEKLDERRKSITLTLLERKFDKKTPYRLVLRTTDEVEVHTVPVLIDRAFQHDF